MSRTACLGNDIIERLYGKDVAIVNFSKSRIDLLSDEKTSKISLLRLYKMFNRYDILVNSIYMQKQNFFDKNIRPKAIFFDSFSELTDQKFTHKKHYFSFYSNFSDLNSDSNSFKKNITSHGLLEVEKLEKYYRLVFEKCADTWGFVPIIFIHFPSKLETREQFKQRANSIKKTIEKLSAEFCNLYSIAIDDDFVDFAKIGNEEYRKLPYHYHNETYEEFVRKIRELGVLNETK